MKALRKLRYGGGIASTPLASPEKVNAPPSGKSARIYRHQFRSNPIVPECFLSEAADIIAMAFPGPSENAVCDAASFALGVDQGVIRRILRKETKNPSYPLLRRAIIILCQRVDDPMQVPAICRFVVGVMSK